MRRLMKTGTYAVMHVSVATLIAFLLTGNIHAALAIGLLEPLVQTVFFYFHETIWESPRRRMDYAHVTVKHNQQSSVPSIF